MLTYNFNRDGALVCKFEPFSGETLIEQKSGGRNCLTVEEVYSGGRHPYYKLIDVKDCLGEMRTYDLCVERAVKRL